MEDGTADGTEDGTADGPEDTPQEMETVVPTRPNSPLVERLDQLETRVADLEKEGVALRSELAATRRTPYLPPPAPSVPTPGTVPPATPRVWPSQPPPPSPSSGHGDSSAGLVVGGPNQTTGRAAKPTIEFTTEMAMKWAGLVLLFLAAAFLVSTAISRGWIGPRLQLAGAVVGGLALIAGGLKLREREGWGESLVFVGLAVLFVCAGASWEWLDLGSAGLAAAFAVLVGVLAIGLARYMSAWTLGLVALAGLIIVPIWWLSVDLRVGLGFSLLYVLSILLVMTFLYLEQKWPVLWVVTVLTSAILTLLMVQNGPWDEIGSSQQTPASGATVVVLLAGLFAAYWIAPLAASIVAAHRLSPQENAAQDQPLGNVDLGLTGLGGMEYRIVLLAPAWLWLSVREFTSMERNESIIMGLVLFAFAVASAVLTRTRVPKAFFATQFVAASIVLAIVLAVAFDGPVLLAAFALQAALLVALIREFDDVWFTLQAAFAAGLTLLITVGRMLEALVSNADWSDDLAHLLVVVLLAIVAMLEYRRSRAPRSLDSDADAAAIALAELDRDRSETFGQLAAFVAYVGLLGWVATVFGHLTQGQGQVSAIWSILAAGLLAVALARRSNKLLQVGLATFGLVVAKLLTVDLAAVDTFWRVGLFFVIGSGLLALSYQLPRLMGAAAATPVGKVPENSPTDTEPETSDQSKR